MSKRRLTQTFLPEEGSNKKVNAQTETPMNESAVVTIRLINMQDTLKALKQENTRIESKIEEVERLISRGISSIAGGIEAPASESYHVVRSKAEGNFPYEGVKIAGIYKDRDTANNAAILAYKNIRLKDSDCDWRDYPVTDYRPSENSLASLDLEDGETVRSIALDGTHTYKFRDDITITGWVSVSSFETYSEAYMDHLAEGTTDLPWKNRRHAGTHLPSRKSEENYSW